RHTSHLMPVAPESELPMIVVSVPDSHSLIRARRSQPPALRTEGHMMNKVGVPLEREQFLSLWAPHPDSLVGAGCRKVLAVRAERHAADPVGMPLKDPQFLAADSVPDSCGSVKACRGQPLPVWAEHHLLDRRGVSL